MVRRSVAPQSRRSSWRAHLTGALFLLSAACTSGTPRTLVLATTTSLDDSGLLAMLVPAFERARGDVRVRVVAVGSGQALALGRRGDADVLLVHSPNDEAAFMAAGHGGRREPVMQNDFLIVGPPDDPAGVRGTRDAVAALRILSAHSATWVSRGDSSGTHRAELALRQRANAPLQLLDVGQGMAETLVLASERGAYTLTDRSTFLALSGQLRLDVVIDRDPQLRNEYSVLTVRKGANRDDADAFADWLLTPGAQRLIAEFGKDRFGTSLFTPVDSVTAHTTSVQ